jgi:hypothetical protein
MFAASIWGTELLLGYVNQRTAFHLRKRLARTEAPIVAFDNEVGEAFRTYLCHER